MDFFLIILSITFLSGVISGVFGGGSGIVLVPGYFFVLSHFYPNSEHHMQVAIATTFATSIFIGIFATIKQYKYKHVSTELLKQHILPILIGGILGVLLMSVIPSESLKIFFAIILLGIAIWMINRVIRPNVKVIHAPKYLKNLLALLAGLFSMSAGVSSFYVPFFIKFGTPIKNAIGSSTVITLIMSICLTPEGILAGLTAKNLPVNTLGYLHYHIFLIGIIPSILGAVGGSKLTHLLSPKILQIIYICMIFFVSGLMIF